MNFLDYNRTVVGFHGTRLSVALVIVQRKRPFDPSTNPDDWLGHGVYFWEHGPRQAFIWAKRRQQKLDWGEPVAVLGSMIRLGRCLDLLDPQNTEYLRDIYERYCEEIVAAGGELPTNANARKYLDCSVFQYAYGVIADELGHPVDTARAVYVPTGANQRVWPRSWIARQTHIQLCVRSTACILGTWLEIVPEDELPVEVANGQVQDAADANEHHLEEGGQAAGDINPEGEGPPVGEGGGNPPQREAEVADRLSQSTG